MGVLEELAACRFRPSRLDEATAILERHGVDCVYRVVDSVITEPGWYLTIPPIEGNVFVLERWYDGDQLTDKWTYHQIAWWYPEREES